ncbi:hypothetical protein D9615_002672 [Tricholomella constricta]|uniref:BTB domain-containing protein n=1 Tax=Tricholomella constricta TaxID=117010 RepID=A0A8H5HNA0_9AGAR|nr:hypothetical protein D9615_002672 [Tricholomella constricta]
MLSLDDFSTNRFSGTNENAKSQLEHMSPSRHSDLCFNDGNLAVLTGGNYFLVHQGLLCRHSAPLARTIEAVEGKQARFLEGRLVLELAEASNDVYYFLLALYDGISTLKYDVNDFGVVSAILQLATTYEVKHLRTDILRGLSSAWPRTLAQWELREARSLSMAGVYEPRKSFPHPILVINLARAAGAPELLPAAFYDLSRSSPSDCAAGYACTLTSRTHHLSDDDLLNLLRGKEHGSRFLSTFIVNELEGREPSSPCVYRMELDGARRRICQSAFEAITFEILRDINGTVCQRSSDPLFAIMDSELMQTREDPLGRLNSTLRACEFCRSEFGAAVDSAREEFWQRLPVWFGVDPLVWA